MAVAGSVLSYYGDTASFQEPYLQSTTAATSPLVPGYLGISIGGHAYLAETGFTPFKQDAYRSDSVAPIADKTDISNIPGYGSVNTEGLWRRMMFNWVEGAGQEYLDRDLKVEQSSRFYTSKGIFPWQENRASLLNDVVSVHSSGNELQVLTVGAYTYINDGGTVRYTNSLTGTPTWSVVAGVTAYTGTPSNAALATDGNNVYIACGASGIYIIKVPGSTAASWVTGTVNSVWYTGGQLVCAAGNLLYSIGIATTATATALTAAGNVAGATALIFTHPNAAFVFSTCAAGNSWVYIGGYTSNALANSAVIYKTQINPLTGAQPLQVPIVAATLPGGEIPYSLYPYANFILLGTSLGARFCETLSANDPGGSAGDLKLGPIVPDQIQQVSSPVKCFTGQFKFIWFGWSNYDAVSTGLGRMDLSTFIDNQAPAYTSDLMVTTGGEILSMDWTNGLNNIAGVTTGSPIFVVNGVGVYTAASTLVAVGTIDTGLITAGLPDKKIALFADFKVTGVGAVGGLITVDQATTFAVPIQNLSNQLVEQSLPTSLKGEEFDFQVMLYAGPSPFLYDSPRGYDSALMYDSGQTSGSGPVLRRLMVKFLPAVVSGTLHKVIINLFRTAETLGVDQAFFPYQEFFYLDALRQSATVVQYQEGTQLSVPIVIKSITRLPYESFGGPEGGFNQRIEVECLTLEN